MVAFDSHMMSFHSHQHLPGSWISHMKSFNSQQHLPGHQCH
jgi:hypothetical protein